MVEKTTHLLTKNPQNILRKQIMINGVVQGVGFRPFIFNLANRYHLSGNVSNSADGVIIEVQGLELNINEFLQSVRNEAPPISMISSLGSMTIPLAQEQDFTILHSQNNASATTLISPDIAICPDCTSELFDPHNRRFLYPFINCTNCGPRFTIIKNIPYDRPFTSMTHFTMCPSCQDEYDTPSDRRFHAQPNACPDCGPQCDMLDSEGRSIPEPNPISSVVDALINGNIVAIKGLGGYHLAVDATSDEAVTRLRYRKEREAKPFAIMVKNLNDANLYFNLSENEKSELQSFPHPIVLVEPKSKSPFAESIAPGLGRIGIMLPYTPLHHLLFYYHSLPLVMTSGNISDEPICIDNSDAVNRLKGIADFFLVHNRDILTRTDDSVLTIQNGKRTFLRRSRGFVPLPIQLPFAIPSVLAVGSFLKNTICVTRGDQAFLSQHIGDLDNASSCRFFNEVIDYILALHQIEPEAIIHDMHPDIYSSIAANEFNLHKISVQHHHAHVAATMAEHHLHGPTLGLALDGFGLSENNEAWGGELFIVKGYSVKKLGSLIPLPHPGGDAASKQAWRMGASVLYCLNKTDLIHSRFSHIPHIEKTVEMMGKSELTSNTTGCGRWFDAAASLLGICDTQAYEGQAPMLLESLVTKPEILSHGWSIDQSVLNLLPLMDYLLECTPVKGANIFHGTLAAGIVDWVTRIGNDRGIKTIACGGGCFVNGILVKLLTDQFYQKGFKVYFPNQVPPGDGGISFGQAWVGSLKLMGRMENS